MEQEAGWDVVIAGAGNAALVAALAAHEHGARVLVLEAAPSAERGGNSRFSGGIFRFPHNGLTELLEIVVNEAAETRQLVASPYTPSDFEADLMATSAGRADRELVGILVEQANDCIRWMRDQGVAWELTIGKLIDPTRVPDAAAYVVPPGAAVRTVGEGSGLMSCLFAAVERAGIEIRYESPVSELITEGSKVTGVRVRLDEQTVDIHGQVVLAAGGFEANPEMRRRYLGTGWDLVKVRGTRFNMGSVLSVALRTGAQPAGHWGGCHASPVDANAPDVGEVAIGSKMSRYSYPYGITVNVNGKRFIDEGEDHVWKTYAKTGAAIRAQPRAAAFQIFDQQTLHLLEPRYALGTPIVADTISALAQKIDIPARHLESTVAEYNDSVRTGDFDPFSNDGLATDGNLVPPKSNWALPINRPPYVAYAVTCGITFTYGGIRTDRHARVLSTEGRPMAGLFATGEITGGIFYHNYPGGSGLMRGAVFGRIAGHAAAAAAEGLEAAEAAPQAISRAG